MKEFNNRISTRILTIFQFFWRNPCQKEDFTKYTDNDIFYAIIINIDISFD